MLNSNDPKCDICENADPGSLRFYTVKEMMFGTGESFEYMECGVCGCLQICEIPANMEKYYPKYDYYSFTETPVGYYGRLKGYIKYKLYRNIFFNKKNILGLLGALIKPPKPSDSLMIYKNLPRENILDVGCGSGRLLDILAEIGFTDLHGIDLYIDGELTTKRGVKIKKGTLHDIHDETYNLIMLHHSLEHMEEQKKVLKRIETLLKPEGVCIVGIPVANYAWETYRADWFQIDAPRHSYIHTEKSLAVLAEDAGLHITKVLYNSTEAQFTASELYKTGIPLKKQTEELKKKEIGIEAISEFMKKAERLNEDNKGDQAIFFLEKKRVTPV